jgi:hypothetical protein
VALEVIPVVYVRTNKYDFSEETTAPDARCKLLSILLFRSALAVKKSISIVGVEKKESADLTTVHLGIKVEERR